MKPDVERTSIARTRRAVESTSPASRTGFIALKEIDVRALSSLEPSDKSKKSGKSYLYLSLAAKAAACASRARIDHCSSIVSEGFGYFGLLGLWGSKARSKWVVDVLKMRVESVNWRCSRKRKPEEA